MSAGEKIWANSGDSHLMEPPDLFKSLPEDIRERAFVAVQRMIELGPTAGVVTAAGGSGAATT